MGTAARALTAPGGRRVWRRVLALAGLLLLLQPGGAAAAALEYVSAGGYVFVRSTTADGLRVGFVVDDADGVGMWSSYQHLGGRRVLGPALSARYGCDATVCQAFERAALRWDPHLARAEPVDVLAELGHDGEALLQHLVHLPHPQAAGAGDELYDTTEGLAATRDSLGAARRLLIGLPVAVGQIGPQTVLRGTRGALFDAGQGGPVAMLGGGQIAVAAGLIPPAALVPRPVPPSTATEPARLVIERLGLDASLESMPPAPDGSLPPPSEPETIAWYTDSAALGEGGTMLLAGHVDWVGRRAAFRELDTLREGDDIQVLDSEGIALQYRVTETKWYPQGSPALHQLMVSPGRGPPTLVLVTCGGPFDLASRTYLERLVVRAEPVDPSNERPE